MNKKIAVTGRPGCGKTTLCHRVAEDFPGKVRGIITEEIREGGKRVGFSLEDLETGETGLLSHVSKCNGPNVGKYSVCLDQFEDLAITAITGETEDLYLLVVDEIGPMELKSEKFIHSVEETIQKDIPCLFTVHRRSNHNLVRKIKEQFDLIKLTKNNRDRVKEKVSRTFARELSDQQGSK